MSWKSEANEQLLYRRMVDATAVVLPVVWSVRARVFGIVRAEHDRDDVPPPLQQSGVLRALPEWTVALLQHRRAAGAQVGDGVGAASVSCVQ
eukprot:CAMPEP_0174733860 /NCGR_PEP_ID=MMETSP1094-20130205/62148_1 /TAXON_ID=156173 /ORGANISM="Chrysochromulina brevifilum, Strain UTEX LB 985" /LENGTH=91 /DNA_ID=CAMNT_0015936579 /DNA_START=688 /DNA_END=962 /DNA_ORIENTATION=+